MGWSVVVVCRAPLRKRTNLGAGWLVGWLGWLVAFWETGIIAFLGLAFKDGAWVLGLVALHCLCCALVDFGATHSACVICFSSIFQFNTLYQIMSGTLCEPRPGNP